MPRVLIGDPADLFNVLASEGRDRGITRAALEAELATHREYTGQERKAPPRKRDSRTGQLFPTQPPDPGDPHGDPLPRTR